MSENTTTPRRVFAADTDQEDFEHFVTASRMKSELASRQVAEGLITNRILLRTLRTRAEAGQSTNEDRRLAKGYESNIRRALRELGLLEVNAPEDEEL